jgi:Niemann-Pick C1 protein
MKVPFGHDKAIGLSDVCFAPLKPDNHECAVQSVFQYFQNKRARIVDEKKFWSTLETCALTNHVQLDCLGEFGGPVDPKLAFGGFIKDKSKGLLNSSVSEP